MQRSELRRAFGMLHTIKLALSGNVPPKEWYEAMTDDETEARVIHEEHTMVAYRRARPELN